MVAVHERLHQETAGALGRVECLAPPPPVGGCRASRRGRACPASSALHRPLVVHAVGERDVDGVDLRVPEQRLVRAVRTLDLRAPPRTPRPAAVRGSRPRRARPSPTRARPGSPAVDVAPSRARPSLIAGSSLRSAPARDVRRRRRRLVGARRRSRRSPRRLARASSSSSSRSEASSPAVHVPRQRARRRSPRSRRAGRAPTRPRAPAASSRAASAIGRRRSTSSRLRVSERLLEGRRLPAPVVRVEAGDPRRGRTRR